MKKTLITMLVLGALLALPSCKADADIPKATNTPNDQSQFVEQSNTNSKTAEVLIPEGTTYIAADAFRGRTDITEITIPESVTSIDATAFKDCTGLTSIIIPGSVKTIGASAFEGCTGLTELILSEGVNEIDSNAFAGCTGLTSVSFPKSIQKLGESAFGNCTALTTITIAEYPIGAFSGCAKLVNVIIPEYATSIAKYAFWGCSNLTSVTIPNSVTNIGNSAFYGCSNLTSITIPNSVKNIGDGVFSNCYKLTKITGPIYNGDALSNIGSGNLELIMTGNIASIDDFAFEHCVDLKSVTIPNSVTSIGGGVFYGCVNLTEVIGPIYNSEPFKDHTWEGPGSIYTKSKIKLVITGDVTCIDNKAFASCDWLVDITIPNSVTSIGESAFSNCDSLISITIPNSVKSIGEGAFYNCDNLTTITGPIYDRKVFNDPYWGPEYYPDIRIELVITGNITSIEDEAFKYCRYLQNITIPDSVTSIGDRAFFACYNLVSVTIPNSVTSIGNEAFYQAFYDHENLTSITYTGTRTSWKKLGVNLWNSETIVYCTDGILK